VITHAIAKSALFMTAGSVTEATGESRLSRLGGLARPLPVLAAVSGIAAATLAALPLTLGFFKDELFFAAAVEEGTAMAIAAVVAAALTFAYIGRFWLGLFAGRLGTAPSRTLPLSLIAPIALLALVALVGGLVVGPFAELASDAATVTYNAPVAVDPAYHLDTRSVNLMALAAWAAGALILLAPRVRDPIAGGAARLGQAIGPRRIYGLTLHALNVTSDRLHDIEVRDLRNSLAAVLVPAAALVGIVFLVTPTAGFYEAGDIVGEDVPLLVLLALAAVAALTALRDRGRLRPVLATSVLGFALAGAYAITGAPDVALVAVVVETVFTVVFVAVFSRLPPSAGGRRDERKARRRRLRNIAVGIGSGLAAFVVIWGALSRPTVAPGDAAEQIEATPEAHGGDVVTVILADFRGLDTMVEITVLLVAVIGAVSLITNRERES
jgi:multicomponent Na+:H+ antiporter subunit A